MTTQYLLMPVNGYNVRVKVEPLPHSSIEGEGEIEELGLKEKAKELASEIIAEVPAAFANLTNTVNALSEGLIEQLNEIHEKVKPQEFSVEFGLSLNAKGDVSVVEVGGEASFKVTLTWKPKAKPNKNL